jgi:hypothetical protein
MGTFSRCHVDGATSDEDRRPRRGVFRFGVVVCAF